MRAGNSGCLRPRTSSRSRVLDWLADRIMYPARSLTWNRQRETTAAGTR